jgi:hypothetical protein
MTILEAVAKRVIHDGAEEWYMEEGFCPRDCLLWAMTLASAYLLSPVEHEQALEPLLEEAAGYVEVTVEELLNAVATAAELNGAERRGIPE